MNEERDCIVCWESDEPETLQPLFPGPGALSDVEPTAWVHKSCLEEYSNHTGDDAEEIAALGKMINVDDGDPEDFVQFEREEMDSAELWERVIADLIDAALGDLGELADLVLDRLVVCADADI
jgi:hypothetical protein